jgi:hypothetical protein
MTGSEDGRYVLEVERRASAPVDPDALARRVRDAARRLRAEGVEVRLLRSVYVPEEGSCFLLLAAPDEAAAAEALRRARVPVVAAAALQNEFGERREAG